MKTHENLLHIVATILIVAMVGGAIFGIGYVIYLWWWGILTGLEHYGVPMIVGFIMMVVALVAMKEWAGVFMSLFGIWTATMILGWWWLWALALYAFPIFLIGVALAFGGIVAVTFGLFAMLSTALSSR